jgi:hypothetical protein
MTLADLPRILVNHLRILENLAQSSRKCVDTLGFLKIRENSPESTKVHKEL